MFVIAANLTQRSKLISGAFGWKPSIGWMRTGPSGNGRVALYRLGGVRGPSVDGNDEVENVGEGVGGIGEYTILVSLKVTCFPGIVFMRLGDDSRLGLGCLSDGALDW